MTVKMVTLSWTSIALLWSTALAAATGLVQTTSGKIQGHSAPGVSGVTEYLGIPYAKPPTGDLRWAPPQVYNSSSLIQASKFGNTCPAQTGIGSASSLEAAAKALNVNLTTQGAEVITSLLGQTDVTYSEDCLTLNIWTKPGSGDKAKAVLFWIYGGGYTTGTTDNTGYNGKYIADQEDVIIVSANYRLNIFGFPGGPNLTQNLGLLDQRLAIEWVRANIAAFGGDPSRITLFGQSAGGSSVDYYSYAWTKDPIVAGLIPESGTVLTPSSQASASSAAESWYNVTGTVGCGDASTDSTTLLSCMRSKSWETIQAAIVTGSGLSSVTGSFGPTIDEQVVFSDYVTRTLAGNFIRKPMLIGNNDYEVGLFKVIFALQNVTYSETIWDFLQLVIYDCPAAYRAAAAVTYGVPTWRYRWFGDFPNERLTTVPDSGAWHGSEVPQIFGTDMDIQNVVQRTTPETAIASYIRGAWASFAKNPSSGLTAYGLPRYNPLGSTLLRLAYNNQTGPNTAFPAQYDATCPALTVLAGALVDLGAL
ncbi:putative carboxylesterase [Exophiala viscosa]|uniref:Carboxylic ester hydrolase n=1 Tax=Exophiala viscosa TaxID=2486360 RepID=A0AAN6DY20_9EURO|nr:putative carboxylesterase [Exophiala viscosa]